MTDLVFDFEKSAMMGEPVPKDLDIADACLYMGLKYLYAMHKSRLMDRKTATEEKRNLLERRSRAVTTLLHYKRISPRDPRMKGGEDEKEQEVKS